ncbi:MAG: hypothetical protein HC879_02990 [Leptolyngbyaceae cyanobacterium SL_5_9]|nr:hypothetical protein [Leptolyngbyaceae cyanobacterium SL_5_9]NJO75621.1 hypothetical protein [Leptolyngbyaceae cyanobacterium RM1_406_9]
MIGQLYREGHLYTQEQGVEVFDHDWKTLAEGVAIPHGLYDLALNIGYVQIGTSHDTSEFACEAIRHGGSSMVPISIKPQVRFSCYVMGVAAIVPASICSSRIYRHWWTS